MGIEIKTEFTHEWTLTNRYFMKDNIQYVERILSFNECEERKETGRSISNRGVLAELDKDMKDLVFSSGCKGIFRSDTGMGAKQILKFNIMKKTKINFLTVAYWMVWVGVMGTLVLLSLASRLHVTVLQSLIPILIPVGIGGVCIFTYIFLNSLVLIGQYVEKWIED